MQGRNRVLKIDICDYTKKIVCPIYDNNADISGQAFNVFINYERNGWKELSFTLPTKCFNQEGVEEDNYRLPYVIADYALRVITETDGNKKKDYFLITEEGIKHEAFSKNVTVTAGHISKLLKNRALDLEFSDKEGNNVGDAKQILDTILEGTSWKPGKVATFYEDDGKTVKIRSMNAAVKTGAFRLIEMMCDLFEAKPVYNGDYTVDILPMNPFSELKPGEIPEAVLPSAINDERFLVNSNVIELHYNSNLKNLERKRNTDNIATRFYAYGSYGDAISKYCSVQTAEHDEYEIIIKESRPEKTEYKIIAKDGTMRCFTAEGIEAGDKLIWSMMDLQSRRYVWNDTQRIAYKVYDEYKMDERVDLTYDVKNVINYFPFLTDYTYYEDVGLLTDEMFQKVAAYQRDMPKYYQASIDAQAELNVVYEQLSDVGVPKSGFLKLDIEKCQQTSDGTKLTIKWSDRYPDGVIYRSDYMEAEKNYFIWHVAQKLKDNGDPVSGPASIIYVLHDTEPVISWECAYIRDIDNRTHLDNEGVLVHDGYNYAISEGERPKELTLWSNLNVSDGDSVYLFCVNSITGYLGEKFSADENAVKEIETQTKLDSETHPTYFVDYNEDLPEITFPNYGWCYQYSSNNYDEAGTLYFSWPARNDSDWKKVSFQAEEPSVEIGGYFYNTSNKILYHGETVIEESPYEKFKKYVDTLEKNSDSYEEIIAILESKSREKSVINKWVKLNTGTDEIELAKQMGVVFMLCRQRDQFYKGLYKEYTYTTGTRLNPANYAFSSAFGYYWLFTTQETVVPGGTLRLNTTTKAVYQDENVEHLLTATSVPQDLLVYPLENDLSDVLLFDGSIFVNDENRNGTDMATDRMYRTNYISIWPNEIYQYELPEECFGVLYDANRNYLGYLEDLTGAGELSTDTSVIYNNTVSGSREIFKQARYLRLAFPKGTIVSDTFPEEYFLRLKNRDGCVFTNDKKYTILKPMIPVINQEPTGINSLIRKFKNLSDQLYLETVPALRKAQDSIKQANEEQGYVLGDIVREAWWQDSSYVDGDEQRMYNDALDNLKKAAQPEYIYTFDFLDLYGSNSDQEYSAKELNEIDWPDIQITDAAHLVDPEIKTNQWAYIDTLKKCYDQPWKTTLEINTRLLSMSQHEFKDVMTRIAQIVSETKAKQTIYSRAEAISSDGTVSAEKITGEIDTTAVTMSGTGWKTDEKGNMILESTDSMAAMMFNGSGLYVANSKDKYGEWNWKTMSNGFGLNADTITSGNLDGARIKPDSITTRSIKSSVGNELDIGSNKALNLFATMDGRKPSGALKTSDAMIEIKAGDEKTPAKINVEAGGEINLKAGADGMRGANLNIGSAGAVNIASGGSIKIEAGATFSVAAGNIEVDKAGNATFTGTIHSTEGEIGGWHIGDDYLGNSNSLSTSTVGLRPSNTINDDIVIWAGSKARARAPFIVRANGKVEAASLSITNGTMDAGDIDGSSVTNSTVSGSTVLDSEIKDGSFTVSKQVDGESVNNLSIDNNGIQLGYNQNGTYNFDTDANGSLRIENIDINGGTIDIGSFSVSNTGSATINNGSIELGSYKENGTNKKYFSVHDDGSVNITKGIIKIQGTGQNAASTEISSAGKLTAEGATLTNTSIAGSASGVITATSGSTLSGWLVDSNNNMSIQQGKYYINNTGDVCFKDIYSDNVSATSKIEAQTINAKKSLQINGTAVSSSSRETKQNIQPLQHSEAFDKLQPVSFQYKHNPNETRFGLIYEDVKKLYPETCIEDEIGFKGISYLDFIAVLIKEVQDLRKRVSDLERK